MAGAMAGGEELANLFVEREQSDRVALQVKKVRQRGGERGGVFTLGVTGRPVRHRTAEIGEQVTPQIGFVLELLDEVTIAPGVHAPIQITRVVVGRVLAILAE